MTTFFCRLSIILSKPTGIIPVAFESKDSGDQIPILKKKLFAVETPLNFLNNQIMNLWKISLQLSQEMCIQLER
jgi:hypothetical protein